MVALMGLSTPGLNDASSQFPVLVAHLLGVEAGHAFHALPIGLGGLAETLLLLPSLQRGLRTEVLVVRVLSVLELDRGCPRLLPLAPLCGGTKVLVFMRSSGFFLSGLGWEGSLTYPFVAAGPLGVPGRGRVLGHHCPDRLLVQQRCEELRGLLQGVAARWAKNG